MNEQRFLELLDLHGADLERWPACERHAAEALVEASPGARELWEEAWTLHALLWRWDAPVPSSDLQRRVREIPHRHARQSARPAWFTPARAAFALVGALAVGVLAGSLPLTDSTPVQAEELAEREGPRWDAADAEDEADEAFAELAFASGFEEQPEP